METERRQYLNGTGEARAAEPAPTPKRMGLQSIDVEGIHLHREGGWVVVSVERDRVWKEVIREWHDGPFSHIIEPSGIAARFGENSGAEKVEKPR